jgi:hypothetical protein
MNIWNNCRKNTEQKINEHLYRYTQFSAAQKQNVHVKVFGATIGGGLLGACLSPKMAPIIGPVTGLATFAYLTREQKQASILAPSFSQIKDQSSIQKNDENIHQLLISSTEKSGIVQRQNLSIQNKSSKQKIEGIQKRIQLSRSDIQCSLIIGLHLNFQCVSQTAFYQAVSNSQLPQKAPFKPIISPTQLLPTDPPTKKEELTASDWKFERDVYKMEMNGLMQRVVELEEELKNHAVQNNGDKNERLKQKLRVLEHKFQGVNQQLNETKLNFEAAEHRWETNQDCLQQTIQNQKIQIGRLKFELQQLKQTSTQDVLADTSKSRASISSNPHLTKIKDQLETVSKAHEVLEADYDKLKQENEQLTHTLKKQNKKIIKQQLTIESSKNEEETLLILWEKIKAKNLKAEINEDQLIEAHLSIDSKAEELIHLRQELNGMKQLCKHLYHQLSSDKIDSILSAFEIRT